MGKRTSNDPVEGHIVAVVVDDVAGCTSHGSASLPLLEDALLPANATLAKRWSTINNVFQDYCHRFQKEILPYLALRRSVHFETSSDLAVGDVVVFFHPTSRRKWPLAKVTQTFPGPYGRVRTLQLAVPDVVGAGPLYLDKKDKLYTRDIKHVAPLFHADSPTPVYT